MARLHRQAAVIVLFVCALRSTQVAEGASSGRAQVQQLDGMDDLRSMMGDTSFESTFSSVLPPKTLEQQEEDALTRSAEDDEVGKVIRAVVHHHLRRELGEAAPTPSSPQHQEFKNLIAKKRKEAEAMMQQEKKRVEGKNKERSEKAVIKERKDKKQVISQVNEAHTIKRLEQKAEEAAKKLPVEPSDQANPERGDSDPSAATADERIAVLKDKIKKAKVRKAFAKKAQVATDAREMSFKVEAGSEEAKAARATVQQMQEKTPSVEDIANERLKKSRDRFEMKELTEKSRRRPSAPRAKATPKQSLGLDSNFTGAALAVMLRNAVNEAKQALLHKDRNPGDKKAEIDAAEAMQHVSELTQKQKGATIRDADEQSKMQDEMETKAMKLKASREIHRKKDNLKKQMEWAAQQKILDAKRNEKERLEKEVRNADANMKIEKQMAKLAEKREKNNLAKSEWEARESSEKANLKTKEQDHVKTVQRRENDVKTMDKVREKEQKQSSHQIETKEKAAIKKVRAVKQDESQKKQLLEADKAKVISMIESAKKFKLEAEKQSKKEAKQLLRQHKQAVAGMSEGQEKQVRKLEVAGREHSDKDRTKKAAAEQKKIQEAGSELAEKATGLAEKQQKNQKSFSKQAAAEMKLKQAQLKLQEQAHQKRIAESSQKQKQAEVGEKTREKQLAEMAAASSAKMPSQLSRPQKEMFSADTAIHKRQKEFEAKTLARAKKEKEEMLKRIDRLTRKQAKVGHDVSKDEKKKATLKAEVKTLEAKDTKEKQLDNIAAESAKAKALSTAEKDKVHAKMTLYEQLLKQKVEAEVNGPYKEMLQQAMRQNVDLKTELEVAMAKPAMKKSIDTQVAKILSRKFQDKVYTVGEAREIEKLETEKVTTEERNRAWAEITNKAAAKAGKSAGDKKGFFMKRGGQGSNSWKLKSVSEKDQKAIQANMRADREKRAKELVAKQADSTSADNDDPREKLYGGPKPWYNRTLA